MREYKIKRWNGNWSEIDTLNVDNVLWYDNYGIEMRAQIGYDDEKLYVHQMAKEENIRCEISEKLGSVCRDSCMEFYFGIEDDPRYFHFEVNYNCVFYIGICFDRQSDVRLIRKDMSFLNARANKTKEGWEVYYEIPFSFLRVFLPNLKLEKGSVLKANIYKCGDDCVHKHYLSWNKVELEKPDFMRREYFGEMILD